ncbi:MAG: CDP-alcohol phosphatidyltransferase family protein [Ignavibacteria bacterium]|nr:CDP-alcohol phosphatidyltransferase family protein [Ignavibacteria bacterium]
MKFNLPNLVSFFRLFSAPFFYVLFTSFDKSTVSLACILYFVAASTDILDGWAARRFGYSTRFGEFIDPLADKFLTTFAFLSFVNLNIMPIWMFAIILLRDTLSTILRIIALAKGSPIKTSKEAKMKTTAQMIFIAYILVLIFAKYNFHIIPAALIDKIIYSWITFVFLLLITLYSVWTILNYIIQYKNLFKQEHLSN